MRVIIDNFPQYTHREFTLPPLSGCLLELGGVVGSGKTTLMDALVMAFTGVYRASVKAIGGAAGSPPQVTIEHIGKNHPDEWTLVRAKRNGNSVTVTIKAADGTSRELTGAGAQEWISERVGIRSDTLYLSSYLAHRGANEGLFMLKPADRRRLLQRYFLREQRLEEVNDWCGRAQINLKAAMQWMLTTKEATDRRRPSGVKRAWLEAVNHTLCAIQVHAEQLVESEFETSGVGRLVMESLSDQAATKRIMMSCAGHAACPADIIVWPDDIIIEAEHANSARVPGALAQRVHDLEKTILDSKGAIQQHTKLSARIDEALRLVKTFRNTVAGESLHKCSQEAVDQLTHELTTLKTVITELEETQKRQMATSQTRKQRQEIMQRIVDAGGSESNAKEFAQSHLNRLTLDAHTAAKFLHDTEEQSYTASRVKSRVCDRLRPLVAQYAHLDQHIALLPHLTAACTSDVWGECPECGICVCVQSEVEKPTTKRRKIIKMEPTRAMALEERNDATSGADLQLVQSVLMELELVDSVECAQLVKSLTTEGNLQIALDAVEMVAKQSEKALGVAVEARNKARSDKDEWTNLVIKPIANGALDSAEMDEVIDGTDITVQLKDGRARVSTLEQSLIDLKARRQSAARHVALQKELSEQLKLFTDLDLSHSNVFDESTEARLVQLKKSTESALVAENTNLNALRSTSRDSLQPMTAFVTQMQQWVGDLWPCELGIARGTEWQHLFKVNRDSYQYAGVNVFQPALQGINAEVNRHLQTIFPGGELSVMLVATGDSETTAKVDTKSFVNGQPIDLNALSGGQFFAVQLAAFAACAVFMGSRLVIIDESIGFTDSETLINCMQVLRDLTTKHDILVIWAAHNVPNSPSDAKLLLHGDSDSFDFVYK